VVATDIREVTRLNSMYTVSRYVTKME